MPENDHDLLIKISTQLEIYMRTQTDYQERTAKKFDELRKDVDNLRTEVASAKSFFSGGKALWGVLSALPVGVIALIFGMERS